jgi:hypothetical protein
VKTTPTPLPTTRGDVERLAKDLRARAYDLGAVRYDPRTYARSNEAEKTRMDAAYAALLSAVDLLVAEARREAIEEAARAVETSRRLSMIAPRDAKTAAAEEIRALGSGAPEGS